LCRSSDTLISRECQFLGMQERHPASACGRGGCFRSGVVSFLPMLSFGRCQWFQVEQRGDRAVVAAADGVRIGVVGEGDACGPQLVDQVRGLAGCVDLCCVGVFWRAAARQEDGQGGQVRQDLVFPDVGVPGPSRVWAGGAGVAMAAPVACRWTRRIPDGVRTARRPAARPAGTGGSPGRPGRAARPCPGRR
jgi:hypothetical protein